MRPRVLSASLLVAGFLLLCSNAQDLTIECPQGWTEIYARCYLGVLTTHLPFDQAYSYCQKYGGKLVEPIGFAMTSLIGDMVTSSDSSVQGVWTGYNRIGFQPVNDDTGATWSDGSVASVDQGVWGNGEPNTQAGQCAVMIKHGGQWVWQMDACMRPRPFVCEATPCPTGTFRCDTGRCVSSDAVCNGENNCGDDTDERNCPADCSQYIFDTEREIDYPSGSQQYGNQQTCQWFVEGALGSRLQIEILQLDTEKGVDILEIWGGGRTLGGSELLHRLSGTTADALTEASLIVSSNNMAVIRFVTDGSQTRSGFRLKWRSDFQCGLVKSPSWNALEGEGNPSTSTQTTENSCYSLCLQDSSCVGISYDLDTGRCTSLRSMPGVKVKATCCVLYVKTCPGEAGSQVLSSIPALGSDLLSTSTAQSLYSPLYPLYHPGGKTHVWTIRAPGRNLITIQVHDLDIGSGDYLQLIDGATYQSPTLVTLTQGSSYQSPFISTGSDIIVYFKSYTYSHRRGFLITYKTGCVYQTESNSGTIESPGFGQGRNYPDVIDCQWTVTSQGGRPLRLTFDSFATESGKDLVEVYKDNGNTVVHTNQGYSGASLPPRVDSSDGRIEVIMRAGATGNERGFRAAYNAGCLPLTDPNLVISPSTSVFENDVVTITCINEYVFVSPYDGRSSVTLTCGSGGEWDTLTFPTCTEVLCGNVPVINNGYLIRVDGVFSGDAAYYACNTGFDLFPTNSTTICTDSGVWEPYPYCFSQNQCPPLLAPINGKLDVVVGNARDYGTVVRFSCLSSNFELVGTSVIVCENQQWSAPTPTCEEIRCGAPYIANATLTPSTNIIQGETIQVTCLAGFRLQGFSTIQCGDYSNLPSCINIDECTEGTSGCSQTCADNVGSFSCSCRDGYTLNSDGRSCNDVNECANNNGDCDGQCFNNAGSYFCSCTSGNTQLFTQNGQLGITIPGSETGLEPWNVYHLNHTCVDIPTVECPDLSRTITNGYALTDSSTFAVGTTVTYLCDMGFELTGSQTITCLSSGLWSGNPPTCTVATCPFPIVSGTDVNPKTEVNYLETFLGTCAVQGLGNVEVSSTCTYSVVDNSYQASISDLQCDFAVDCGTPQRLAGSSAYVVTSTSYGASFTFGCRQPYFTLQGSTSQGGNTQVTCLGDGRWDFGDLRCIDPSCTDPGTSPGTIQDATSYEEHSLVYYRCDKAGFELTDTRPLQCQWQPLQNKLEWNGTKPSCVDTSPPSFINCDQNVLNIPILTSPSQGDPSATDNVKVTSFQVTPARHAMRQVLERSKSVTYLASDARGNQQNCNIDIIVIDQEPPVITCLPSFTVTLATETDVQVFGVNQLVNSSQDNSNSVTVSMTPSELRVDKTSVGETYTVRAVASDPTGNTDDCLVQVKVEAPTCVPWTVHVDNANTVCVANGNGYRCTVTCNQDYVMYEDPQLDTVDLTCSNGGDWSRSYPQCVAWREINYRQIFRLRYAFNNVIDSSCAGVYEDQLQVRRSEFVSGLNDLCSVTPVDTTVAMTPNNPTVTIQNDYVYGTYTIDITAATGSSSIQTEASLQQCAGLIRNAFVGVQSEMTPVVTLNSQGICISSSTAQFDRSIQDGLECSTNEENYNLAGRQYCVSCPSGFSSQNGVTCSPCPPATYFSQSQLACVACPTDARWGGTGARSEMDCYLTCPYGYTSSTGEALCDICPRNTYSIDRFTCNPCPGGDFTSDNGQWLQSSCKSRCSAGRYSVTGLAPCELCPKGFYQENEGSKTCVACQDDISTVVTGAISQSECSVNASQLCDSLKCLNGATCLVAGHDYFCVCREGYTGQNCGTYINPCSSQPCYNQGICTPTGTTTYQCACPTQQLQGFNCENNTNEICKNNPCQNYGGCKTGVANYMCLCPSYSMYTYGSSGFGAECTQLRNPCTAFPCQNGATCEAYGNIRRRCVCTPGFTGDACESAIDSCLDNPCKNNAQCITGPSGTYSCVCPDGFAGNQCEQRVSRCDVNSCSSFATCIDNYLTNDILCYCQEGFIRDGSGNCIQILNEVCNPNPCENSGICYRDGNTYNCLCNPGYEGVNCQHNTDDCDPNPCQHGGVCADLDPPPFNGYRFSCACNSDTYGDTCLDAVDICQASTNPCNPIYSNCIDLYRDYYCECLQGSGYFGRNCTESENLLCSSFPCQHGGTCTQFGSSYNCQCTSGYEGLNCESLKDNCLGNPCGNQGTCISYNGGYKCVCPYGFRGDNCQTSVDLCDLANPCQGVGSTCTDFRGYVTCSCGVGYSDPYCQTKDDACSASSCENGATCIETNTGISCSCPTGYGGSRCETNIDDCVNNNCPAGSVCIDGVNGFQCECESNRLGDDCQKVVSMDFDVLLSGKSTHQPSDYQRLVQPINRQAFTVSAWVRYTKKSTPGTALSLYGLSSASDFTNPSKILSINSNNVQLGFGGTRTLAFSPALDDGYWHHVAVVWNSNQGSAQVLVDGNQVTSASNYASQQSVQPFGWLILGGDYDSSTGSVDQSQGMTGRLSQVYISENSLSQPEVANLVSSKSAAPAGAIPGFSVPMATGSSAAVDYSSGLLTGNCLPGSNCRDLNAISSAPQFSSCPSDQTTVSSRTDSPSWQVPVSGSTGTVIRTTTLSGATEMGWGVYGVAYANVDGEGNADMCAFRFYNRRTACERPVDNQGQTQSCTSVNGVLRCSVQCANGFKLSLPAPKYYSCGPDGMFDANDRVLPFDYPSCSACSTPLNNASFQLTFTLTTSQGCGTSSQTAAESVLLSDVRSSLISLESTWPGLCGQLTCGTVPVVVTCNSGVTAVGVVLGDVSGILTKFDGSNALGIEEILTIALIEDNVFTYPGKATPDILSLDVTMTPTCPSGKFLNGDCCSECGLGHYFNTDTDVCTACPKGSYLNTLGTSGTTSSNPCVQCNTGSTTASDGAKSSQECVESCQPGLYLDSITNGCEACPIGFYAESSGSVFCDGCPYQESTPGTSTANMTACSVNPITTTTTTTAPQTQAPSIGASTNDDSDTAMILLIVIALLLLLIVLIIIILFCCFREWMERVCPCLTTKITPESKSQWHYVDRFGETNLKFVSYRMNEVPKSDKESLVSEDARSANISLQVPIFEEQLNGNVVKKAVHVAEHTPEEEKPKKKHKRKRSRSRRRRKMEDQTVTNENETDPANLPPLQPNVRGNVPPMSTGDDTVERSVRRPPSAFRKPKPKLDEVPYDDFIPSPKSPKSSMADQTPRSRITLDSDDDLR